MMGDLSRAFGADASNFNAEASQNKRHQNKFGSGSGNIQRSGHYEPKDGHAFFAATSAPFAVAMDSPPKPNPEVEELKKQLQQRDQAIAGLQQQLMAARGLHAKAQEYKRRAHAAEVSLNQALASHNTPSASRSTSKVHKEVKISPTMFSITNNGVKRNELSRCASMGTRSSLEAAALGSQHDRIAERIIMGVDNHAKYTDYFNSTKFAQDLSHLCTKVAAILNGEERVLRIPSPCYIFGDLHGNIQDLQFFREKIWTLGLDLTAGNFLCLGDYVDRGNSSLEVVAYMLALKCICPNKMFLLRGNHELRSVNSQEGHYGKGSFISQCKERFGENVGNKIWKCVNECFDYLPLAAVVDDSVFCVHGGIPRRVGPKFQNMLDAVNHLPKRMSVMPSYSYETQDHVNLAMDLLWGDPARADQESRLDAFGFGPSQRGGSVSNFGTKAIDNFLQQNGLSYIIRAHEATANGIRISKGAKVFTVFSTSKNHNCGADATCGCILVDNNRIHAINRAIEKKKPEVQDREPGKQMRFSHH